MTTFDASTTGGRTTTGGHMPDETPTAVATPFDPAAEAPESLLDQLRARVEDRDEEESEPWVKEIPKVGIRLVCDPLIEAVDYQRWVKAAQPRGKGGRRTPSPLDLNQFELSVRALTATNLRLEYQSGKDWKPMAAVGSSEPWTLESTELLRAFNVMDSGSLLRKLFRTDARVVDAGQELLAAAGWLGDGEDDENP